MNNYKIKVNDEAESKEAQELFFELGYKKEDFDAYDYPHYIACYKDFTFSNYRIDSSIDEWTSLTLPQLRDLVAQSKNEQGLISGADALRALADGDYVEYWCEDLEQWVFMDMQNHFKRKFRLKPRTIKLELEIPACGTNYKHGQLIWVLNSLEPKEYCSVILDESDELPAYWWSTEEEIKQVVAALRGGIKG